MSPTRPPAGRATRTAVAVAAVTTTAALGSACAPALAPAGPPVAAVSRSAAGGEVVPAAPRANAAAPSTLFAGAPTPGGRSAEWRGTWTAGARRGAMSVQLREAASGAGAPTGDLAGAVVLSVTPRTDALTNRSARSAGRVTAPLARARDEAGRLLLTTEPYYDPACECTVVGTYRGAVRGDSIVGTYVTAGAATAAGTRGRWRVVRVAPAAARAP